MQGQEPTHILLATLGGQPQLITFTLDLLLQQGIPIREVTVVHTASYAGLEHSIARLNDEFHDDCYKAAGLPIRFQRHILSQYGVPIKDIVDERTTDAALYAINELIRNLKQSNHIIHFSISGGRRLVGFLSFSAALLNFEPADRLWHIYTPEATTQRVRDGAIMHIVPEDGIRLIEVPFTRLAPSFLSQTLKADAHTGRQSAETQAEKMTTEQRERCKRVVDQLSPTELKVLQAFAHGYHPKEVAAQFKRELSTINSHTHKILQKYKEVWDVPEDRRLDYRSLYETFKHYFEDESTAIY